MILITETAVVELYHPRTSTPVTTTVTLTS